ncbi:hypothetical protein EASAB2608_08154 [Streptomyces sp. EAS-AB2608]|nr:hypothetical protein EASAB2608_08154 [Streptomyces sp. EAS-AB2608]
MAGKGEGKVTWVKVDVSPPVTTAALVELGCSLPVWVMLMISASRSVADGQARLGPTRPDRFAAKRSLE